MRQPDFAALRERLIETTLRDQGITDEAVLRAMREVPREEFVPDELRDQAYHNHPLPIGAGQTVSQPYIVAVMIEALNLKSVGRVLEIGTGSGYSAAILSRLTEQVYSVERLSELAAAARDRLSCLGFLNVLVRHADGTLGWPEQGPFDAIVVTAGGPKVPRALLRQLQIGGRMVIPVGPRENEQHLLRIVRQDRNRFAMKVLGRVLFVPLIGNAGWQVAEPSP